MATRTQLYRALSKLGLCSRTDARVFITKGCVSVNTRIIFDPLVWVDYAEDDIRIDSRCMETDTVPATIPRNTNTGRRIYLVLYKMKGYVTTRRDERSRPTVYDLLPPPWDRYYLFPIGRLDKDSEGILLLTNDGDFLQAVTDPLSHVPKTYRVLLDRYPPESGLALLRNGGMRMDGTALRPATVAHEKGRWFQVTLYEGKNRQVRRMFQVIGGKVKRLIRIAIGPITIGDLKPGEVRELSVEERKALSP